ncbi:MAG TPA: glycosyltransferase [Terriglobales bacterium]
MAARFDVIFETYRSVTETASLSVIVPTKNRPRDLEAAVDSLLRQTVLPRQLVIIDQSSSGESESQIRSRLAAVPPQVRDLLKVDYIRDEGISGLASARNRAMQLANQELWLFLDDDVVLEPEFIKELAAVYEARAGVAGISGVVTNYPSPPRLFRMWNALFVRGPLRDDRQAVYWKADRLRNAAPVRVSRLGGGLMSFRAQAIRGLKFDESLRGVSDGEDVDFCARLGPEAILMIAPRARLVHNQSLSGREQDYWLRRSARGLCYLYWKNWDHGVRNRLCFAWLNAGYALVATWGSLRRFSLQPWRALLSGVREAREVAGRMIHG